MNDKSLTSVYSTEIAKIKLSKVFAESVPLVDITNNLTDISRVALAAMCDGFTITSSGNNVSADFEVTRAPAIADSLINDFNLPITRERVETTSGTGNKASQSVYYINGDDLNELLSDPEGVLSKNKTLNEMKAWGRTQRDLKRLVQQFGADEVISCINQLSSSNDDSPSVKAG